MALTIEAIKFNHDRPFPLGLARVSRSVIPGTWLIFKWYAIGALLFVARPHADDWIHILARGGEVQASEEGLRFVPAARVGGRVTVAVVSSDKIAGTTIDLQ